MPDALDMFDEVDAKDRRASGARVLAGADEMRRKAEAEQAAKEEKVKTSIQAWTRDTSRLMILKAWAYLGREPVVRGGILVSPMAALGEVGFRRAMKRKAEGENDGRE